MRASLALVGKVMFDKPYRVSALFAFLRQVWKVRKAFGIREIGDNLYVFQLYMVENKVRALQEGPWIFDKQIILLA